jgi:hypothetical protein
MRITRRHLATAGALAFATGSLPLAGHAESTDETAVIRAIDELVQAMVAADKAKLEALVSDQLSYGHSGGQVQDKADFINVIVSKKTIYKSIKLTDATVAVAGNNAIARHTFAADVEAGGQASSPKLSVLQVWVKDGGAWKLLARQGFKT